MHHQPTALLQVPNQALDRVATLALPGIPTAGCSRQTSRYVPRIPRAIPTRRCLPRPHQTALADIGYNSFFVQLYNQQTSLTALRLVSFDPERHVFTSDSFQSAVNEAVAFIESTDAHSLPPEHTFRGPGVYLMYYTGGFESYAALSNANDNELTVPIYAGKATPKGWRRGRSAGDLSKKLHSRLREHARSIQHAENLSLRDFQCRFAILKGEEVDMISTIENALIRKHRPLWNTSIDGFGNHHPGKNRMNQRLSEWDALHPGRSWEKQWQGEKPDTGVVAEKVEAYLAEEL